jgi:hypothetical protein
MNKKIMNKKYLLSLFVLFSFFIAKDVFASSVFLSAPKNIVGLEEQFYVDLLVDPEGSVINGVDGSINFNDEEISLIRTEEGKSVIGLWIESPKVVEKNIIKLSGVIPNGFDGVIDPFNPKHKLPGIVARFVFKGLKPSKSHIITSPFVVSLNDGLGTLENKESFNVSIAVQNILTPFVYTNPTDINPELEYEIIRDPNLFNNKYTLIFQAKDKITGIEKVMIKEGRKDWKEIESPYQLEDQSRHSVISLLAINFSGASIIKTIEPLPRDIINPVNIIMVIVFAILVFVILKKIYDKYKK